MVDYAATTDKTYDHVISPIILSFCDSESLIFSNHYFNVMCYEYLKGPKYFVG